MNEQKNENKNGEGPKRAFLHFNTHEFSWWQTALGLIGAAAFIGLSVKATNAVCSSVGGFFGGIYSRNKDVIETAEYNEVPNENENENVNPFKRAA